MSDKLNQLISDLPEVYQTIFGHTEWDGNASRDCNERLDIIYKIYSVLSVKLGRPLKVLDLGCAQGFFSLSLASKGATVQGIDFLDKNIAVCKTLADENKSFDVQFETGRIEDIIESIMPREYDLVIGLSVFHHLVHEHGVEVVKKLLSKLANSVHAIILELAVKEEPLYWAPSLPEHAYELIDDCSFYKKIAQYDTHLSNISRPMYVVSNDYLILDNFCENFTSYTKLPYKTASTVHQDSRRYYFNAQMVCKLYNFEKADLSSYELERSKKELSQEIAFLTSPPAQFSSPALLNSGIDTDEGWVVMERISGELLSDKLKKCDNPDLDSIIIDLLNQLVILEENGYYHDDIRPWNVFISHDNNAQLIDFGSISKEKKDCVWPDNIFLAFILFLKEITIPNKISQGVLRPASLSPFDLPERYSSWIYAFWKEPTETWSFELLRELYLKKEALPSYQSEISGTGEWIKAQEKLLMNNQSHVHKLIIENNENQLRLNQVENHISKSLDAKIINFNEQIHSIDGKVLTLNNDFTQSTEQIKVLLASYQEQLNALEFKFECRFNQSLESANEIKTNIDKIESNIKDITLEDMPHSELVKNIKELQHQNSYLANENGRLHAHIAAMTHSSSWRITSGWRKGGHYVKLMKNNSASILLKKLVKKLSFKTIVFINNRPYLKVKIINIVSKLGIYDSLLKFYKRVNASATPRSQNNINVDETITAAHSNEKQLPALVKEIYTKLKR